MDGTVSQVSAELFLLKNGETLDFSMIWVTFTEIVHAKWLMAPKALNFISK
jgi:hypothetical protein